MLQYCFCPSHLLCSFVFKTKGGVLIKSCVLCFAINRLQPFLSSHFAVASVYMPIKWQKKHQEISRELKIFKGFLKLANADINISCLLNGRKHRTEKKHKGPVINYEKWRGKEKYVGKIKISVSPPPPCRPSKQQVSPLLYSIFT